MSAKKAGSLPVCIYHHISRFRGGLTFSPDVFEEHCRVMAEKGWRGVGPEEAENFFLHGEPLPPKSFFITLDDGYLDNYVYAWPILSKYGHKAMIFPVADRITEAGGHLPADETPALRPTLADVWSGRIRTEELPGVDAPLRDTGLGYAVRADQFFTWHEARAMQASGVISFGGHSLRHEDVFVSPEFTDFAQPGPVKIAFGHTVRDACWGMPLFRRQPELAGRAFIPRPELVAAIRELVPQDEPGALAFFREQRSREGLRALVASFQDEPGRYESEEEQRARIFGIMRDTGAILHRELGRPIRGFCWPWGVKSPLSLEVGRAAGFEVFYNVGPGPNPPCRPMGINRFNAKRDAGKNLNRLRIYSRPLLGELYRRCRI